MKTARPVQHAITEDANAYYHLRVSSGEVAIDIGDWRDWHRADLGERCALVP
jgi:hypothetical protein